MTNERFLIESYFVIAALSLILGWTAYVYLWRPFDDFLSSRATKNLRAILRRLFPFGMILPALLGFLSVSYWSCNQDTYEKIVRDRQYLIQKNQEQVSAALFSIAMATLFWDVVLIVVQKYGHPKAEK